jgi:Flp pilus assembly protein TadD
MLECTICGLLSLNARSCPACGSQNLIDLASEDNDPSMPTEVPGLDDAVNSLYDLEGIDKVEQDSDAEFTQAKKSTSTSSLPFGFSGQSNVHLSRLPFGIGSQAEGVPFESEEEDKAEEMPVAVSNSVNKITPNPILVEQNKPIVEVPKAMTMVRVEPISEPVIQETGLQEVVESIPDQISIPDEWRITAIEPNLDEIYSVPETVVEVVHQTEDDVLVYNHQEVDNSRANNSDSQVVEETSSLSLELHPAKALNVDLDGNIDLTSELEKGYFAIANNSWAEAAISFQKLASRMPGDAAIFNNYGLSLLQRAIEMANGGDESIRIMSSSQFESAILALREAAKSNPDESIILLNLSHALLVSGRAEKALKIVEVHNSRNPSSLEGANLEAAALVSIGQSVTAKNKLSSFKGDSIIDENLSRLL